MDENKRTYKCIKLVYFEKFDGRVSEIMEFLKILHGVKLICKRRKKKGDDIIDWKHQALQ